MLVAGPFSIWAVPSLPIELSGRFILPVRPHTPPSQRRRRGRGALGEARPRGCRSAPGGAVPADTLDAAASGPPGNGPALPALPTYPAPSRRGPAAPSAGCHVGLDAHAVGGDENWSSCLEE